MLTPRIKYMYQRDPARFDPHYQKKPKKKDEEEQEEDCL